MCRRFAYIVYVTWTGEPASQQSLVYWVLPQPEEPEGDGVAEPLPPDPEAFELAGRSKAIQRFQAALHELIAAARRGL